MPIVTVDVTTYPSIQTVTNLVRSDIRDDMAGATGTIGEGQILVDNIATSVTMANFYNSAVRELSRQLRLVRAPMLIVDNYVLSGIPPMNGPMGLAVADPSVQVYISTSGYWNGSTFQTAWSLPAGCFQVTKCMERETGSQNNFTHMAEPQNGLDGLTQTNGWGRWEWRQDRVNLPGSLDTRDLWMRYDMLLQAQFVQAANPATTYLPIMDCEESIARKIDRMYAYRQGGTMLMMARQEEKDATNAFLNEQIHRQQGVEYQTNAYGNEAAPLLSFGQ